MLLTCSQAVLRLTVINDVVEPLAFQLCFATRTMSLLQGTLDAAMLSLVLVLW